MLRSRRGSSQGLPGDPVASISFLSRNTLKGASMKKFLRALVAVGSVTAASAAMALPASATTTAGPHYYLSLGDSLAQGVQPNANGISLETDQGYVDDILSAQLATDPSLEAVKLGCPGESTHSFLNGGVCATPYYSQATAAVNFLKKYGSKTSFITIDIGANNVDGCAPGGVIDSNCITKGVKQAQHDLPIILTKIRAVAPNVPIYAMNYYDPFLAAYLLPGGVGVQLAQESVVLSNSFNGLLGQVYSAFHIPVADVSTTPFATTDFSFSDGYTLGGNPIPNNVGNLCGLTYNCTPAPVGPNIHANPAGYQAIAADFLALINPS